MVGLEDHYIYRGKYMPNQNTTPHIVKDIDGQYWVSSLRFKRHS